jgi:tRNA (cmo5U34)-methyltransferase
MDREEIEAIFDRQAEHYDAQSERMAPLRDALYFLVERAFARLPEDAHILCIGAASGKEIIHLARRFPSFRFTAVDPARNMIEVCRAALRREGIEARCDLHHGYLESLPRRSQPFHGATCFLVSQFILDREVRVALFEQIATRLAPEGVLASADLSVGAREEDFDVLLPLWMEIMTGGEVPEARIANAREVYRRDVAVLPPEEVTSIIEAGGFERVTQCFQAGMLHAWIAMRAGRVAHVS